MTRPYEELREKMSPEARKKAKTLADKAVGEIYNQREYPRKSAAFAMGKRFMAAGRPFACEVGYHAFEVYYPPSTANSDISAIIHHHHRCKFCDQTIKKWPGRIP